MSAPIGGEGGGGGGIERVFLGWERPVLHAVADRLVEGAPGPGPVDLRSEWVVVPGGRAGRRLLELLLDRAEAAGRPLRPPQVVPVGALPERLLPDPEPAPPEIVERLAWMRALDAVPGRRLARVFPELEGRADPLLRFGVAETLRGLHREVGGSGHDFADVATLCRGSFLYNDEERWVLLAEVQARYRRILEAHGLRDREALRLEALARGEVRTEGAIRIVASPDLPRIVRAFLALAASRIPVEALVAAPPDLASAFDGFGCVDPEVWRTLHAELPEEAIHVEADPGAQADRVIAHLAEAAQGKAPDDVTIGVPDPEVVPFLVERLGEVGVEAHDAAGRPLSRTPPFRILEALAAHAEGRDFESLAALVRHPEVDRFLAKVRSDLRVGSLLSVVDRYHATHLPFRVPPRGRLPWGGESPGPPLEPTVRALRDAVDELLAPLAATRPLREWPEPLSSLLVVLQGGSPLDPERPGDVEWTALAEAVQRVIEPFGRLPSELDLPLSGHQALRIVLEAVRGVQVPMEPSGPAVELVGWLELPLDDAEVLFLTGANEPHLPEGVSADPFLPQALREALGLLGHPGRWARDLFHLRTLLATRPSLRVLAGRRDASGAPLRLSRLLLAEDPQTVARRIVAFLDPAAASPEAELEASGASGAPLQAKGREAEGPRAGSPASPSSAMGSKSVGIGPVHLPPESEIPLPEPPLRIAVTDFRVLLDDPYRWALTRVRKLRDEDDAARELDAAAFGILAHRVLERFGAGPEADATDPDRVRAVLFDFLDSESRTRFGDHPLPAVRLQVEQLRLRLGGFARWQAERAQAGWRIRAVEAETPGDGVPFDVDGVPVLLRGKVDRIDHHERDGSWSVLDYKTGDTAPDPEKTHRRGRREEQRWIDLQLPLYHHILRHLVDAAGTPIAPDPNPERIAVGFLVLPRDPEGVTSQMADWTAVEFEEALGAARDAIRGLLRGPVAFDPGRGRRWRDDPLRAVVGEGVLRLAGEGADDD